MMMSEDQLDLESRELCPDGSCIGVLGDDRKCKVCGMASDGTPGVRVEREEQDEPEEMEASGSDADADAGADAGDERELCPDGTCIGLIGADGRCKVCGARGSTAAS
jgi:hypothetical protein